MSTWIAGRKDQGIKGFSLVEMLVVIALFAVMLTIAVSLLTSYRQNTNLREAAGALAEDIKLAKQRAVAENVNYTITFNQVNNSYRIQGGTYDVTKSPGDFGNGIFIYYQNFGGGVINFQTRGTCSAGTITLKNGINSTVDIVINLMGRVKIGTVTTV